MAINIYREPAETSTPYLPVYFDVSSDAGTITSMISDIYVNGGLVSTIEKQPIIGTTNTFRFEVGEILKKHFTNDNSFSGSNILRESNGSSLNYYIRAFEVFDNGTTFDTSWTESGAGVGYIQSSTNYAFDGVMNYGQDITDYIVGSTSKFFLTNKPYTNSTIGLFRPNGSKVFRGVQFNLGFLVEQECNVRVLEYASDYTQLVDTSITNLTPSNNMAIYSFNGDYNANTLYARFVVRDVSNTRITEEYVFIVDSFCEDATTVYWKNQFGIYEYYVFKGNDKKKASSKQKYNTRRLDYGYSMGDRGQSVRFSTNTEEFELHTDTINEATADWLHEIYQSTDVFIYENNEEIPIIVKGGQQVSTNNETPITKFYFRYVHANPKQSQIG